MKATIFVCLIITIPLHTNAQTNCYFKPDNKKILHNKSLNYFLNNTRDSFKTSYQVKDIPPYVREQFNCLIDDTLLANPNEDYSSGCVMYEGVPRRQLVFHALNTSNFIILYHHGGFSLATRALFMRFSQEKLIDVWIGGVDYETKTLRELVDCIQKQQKEMKEMGDDYVDENQYVSF